LNLFSGYIPGSLGSLSNLNDLMMWQNNLKGEIPAKLSSLKSLRNLFLDYNNLTGTIPDGLANCTNLNWISLTSNKLTGSIPIWIGKLEKLVALAHANNSLTGSIPPELGYCKGLIYLDLGSNQLTGYIPPALAKQSGKIMPNLLVKDWLFMSAIIRDNGRCRHKHVTLEINGIRYNDWMRIPSMRGCDIMVAQIRLTGEFLTNNMSFLFLDLSYNQLNGTIPTEISAMQSLIVLYLEHNYLSGQLPPEFGGLNRLIYLDLSHNRLEGSIPSSFSDLSLSMLNLSNNQLSGPIPQQGSLVTYPENAFENNTGLCGLPLPPCSSRSKPNIDGSQHSSRTDLYSQIWWIVLGLLFCVFFIIGHVIGRFL
jgi:protein brassinosteroid insensitive 1